MRRRKIKTNRVMNCEEFEIDGVYRNWEPSQSDIHLICNRIQERIEEKPEWYRYGDKRYIDTNYYTLFQHRIFVE